MSNLRWVLTDVAKDLYIENFVLGSDDLAIPAEKPWRIAKRRLRGGLRDGVDLIEIDNGALSFSVVPTRGMGIWKGAYRGMPLGWQSPVRGPVNPQYVNLSDRGGIGWIAGFDEWIVRCGLDSNGAPGADTILDNNGNPQTVMLPLHGKIANLPADRVQVRVGLTEPFPITVSGQVEEAALFCPQLQLRTEITTFPMSNRMIIRDEVVNLRSVPAELELLYHCNFGGPVLDEGARLSAPVAEVAPRDGRAAEGMDKYAVYPGPTAGYIEQCYWFDLLEKGGDRETLAMLRNAAGDKGCVLRYSKRELPCFTLWKNPGAVSDGYVTGLEPGTNYPNPKAFERRQGRVVTIAPGASYTINLTVEVHDTKAGVAGVEREIADIQRRAAPAVHKLPHAKYSPPAGR